MIFPFFSSKLWLTTWTFSVDTRVAMFSVGLNDWSFNSRPVIYHRLAPQPPAPCCCKAQAVFLKRVKSHSGFRNKRI